jgi:protein arginine kinase activator
VAPPTPSLQPLRLLFHAGGKPYDSSRMKCDKCDKPAVVHEVVIQKGVKREVHLCNEHAAESGYVVNPSINQMLGQFVISHAAAGTAQGAQKTCPSCGLTLAMFRKSGTLGCPECYEAFLEELDPLIQRAQAGGTHHVGKAPQRAGAALDRQLELRRLMRELDQAVAAEEYERAAEIRDRLMNLGPEGSDRGASGAEHVGETRPERARRSGEAPSRRPRSGDEPAAPDEPGQAGG